MLSVLLVIPLVKSRYIATYPSTLPTSPSVIVEQFHLNGLDYLTYWVDMYHYSYYYTVRPECMLYHSSMFTTLDKSKCHMRAECGDMYVHVNERELLGDTAMCIGIKNEGGTFRKLFFKEEIYNVKDRTMFSFNVKSHQIQYLLQGFDLYYTFTFCSHYKKFSEYSIRIKNWANDFDIYLPDVRCKPKYIMTLSKIDGVFDISSAYKLWFTYNFPDSPEIQPSLNYLIYRSQVYFNLDFKIISYLTNVSDNYDPEYHQKFYYAVLPHDEMTIFQPITHFIDDKILKPIGEFLSHSVENVEDFLLRLLMSLLKKLNYILLYVISVLIKFFDVGDLFILLLTFYCFNCKFFLSLILSLLVVLLKFSLKQFFNYG